MHFINGLHQCSKSFLFLVNFCLSMEVRCFPELQRQTRFNFTDHLYTTLVHKGIKAFRDDTLKRGEEIAPEILKAIEESRFSIVVFSENYANSGWCLNEHVKIMECRKEMEQPVVPIFYHGDPSDVRKQMGSFGEAFSRYEKDSKENVQSWR